MMDRGDIVSLTSNAEAAASSGGEMESKLGVISVKDLKSILESMGKSAW